MDRASVVECMGPSQGRFRDDDRTLPAHCPDLHQGRALDHVHPRGSPTGQQLPARGDPRPRWRQFQRVLQAQHGSTAAAVDDVDASKPSRVIDLDPRTNRTYHYWHVFVPGVTAGQIYAYRVAGPFDPEHGLRFDPEKVLLDPYGKCIARLATRNRQAARQPGDNAAAALRSVVVDPACYDWEGDAPLGRPFA